MSLPRSVSDELYAVADALASEDFDIVFAAVSHAERRFFRSPNEAAIFRTFEPSISREIAALFRNGDPDGPLVLGPLTTKPNGTRVRKPQRNGTRRGGPARTALRAEIDAAVASPVAIGVEGIGGRT